MDELVLLSELTRLQQNFTDDLIHELSKEFQSPTGANPSATDLANITAPDGKPQGGGFNQPLIRSSACGKPALLVQKRASGTSLGANSLMLRRRVA